jgi:hypothetical protein
MRIAAGIVSIMSGIALSAALVLKLRLGIHGFGDPCFLSFFISAVFVVVSGMFCLKRRYWKLCFSSALVAVLFVAYRLAAGAYSTAGSSWLFWPFTITGTLPIIFVCLRINEWRGIRGRLGLSTR